jgi:hypothetical protein
VQPLLVLEVAGAVLLLVVEDEVDLVVVVDDKAAVVVVDVRKVVDEVEALVVLVVLLTGLVPPPLLETWKLPVNLISLELAPTLTLNVPAGTTHCCRPTSQ